jgi:hypothetical protein
MTANTREIIKMYRRDNPGVLLNLSHMLNYGRHGSTRHICLLHGDQLFEPQIDQNIVISPSTDFFFSTQVSLIEILTLSL